MAGTGNWEEKTLKKIADEQRLTALGTSRELELADQPNFQVYEFTPNKRLDGKKRYYLAGPDYSIMIQSSALKAAHDFLGNRLGFNFTFEEWFEHWESGFSFGINRTGTTGLVTNYPLRKVGDKPGWRENRDERPGYLEWKNPNAKANPSYRVIEYWPDKSIKEKSYVLTGSDLQIVQQILQIEYEGGGNAIADSDSFVGGWFGIRRGQPEILLSFWEDKEDLEVGYNRVQGKIRFRIMDKTDDPDSPLAKLTWTDIGQYRDRLVQQFQSPNNGLGLVWRKGKDLLTYTDKSRGYESRILCRDEASGRAVITGLLAVQNHIINERKLNFSSPVNPTLAHPTIPEQKLILGKTRKMPRTRPIADVRFSRAVMYLQYWPEPIVLVANRKAQPLPSD